MLSLLIVLTICFPWIGAAAVLLAGDQRPRAQHTLAVIFSAAAALTGLAMLPQATPQTILSIPVGGTFGDFTFVPDGLGVFLAVVATVIGSLAIVFSIDYMRGEVALGRYYALVLFFIGGMAGLVLTGSLLLLFAFWEITALCSYGLISFRNDDPKAVRGGIKALIVTQVGGTGLLAGALIAFAYTGGYDLADFIIRAQTLDPVPLALIAYGFLIAAAAKSAQVPFQTWLPDAMEAPTPVSALIHAATMVNAGVYLLVRFYPAFSNVPGWTGSVAAIGLVSVLLAAAMALVTDDLKRALAYSTISQLGYMVTAIGVGAIYASQFHLLSHAVFKALLFLAAGAVIHAMGTRDMRAMGGLGRSIPFVRTVFVIGALALAGIPIVNGFWSKELVLEGALGSGNLLVWVGLVLGAGMTALYTFRMVWMVFAGEPRHDRHPHDAGNAMRISLALLAFGTLTTWLLAGPFERLLSPEHAVGSPWSATLSLCGEVLAAPATYLALAVIAMGLAAWWYRKRLAVVTIMFRRLARLAQSGFGFEWINEQIVAAATAASQTLRTTQSGFLNWNVAGIVGGLVILLAVLFVRG